MSKTISAVICCKNEEALIGRCLESIKDADEIATTLANLVAIFLRTKLIS